MEWTATRTPLTSVVMINSTSTGNEIPCCIPSTIEVRTLGPGNRGAFASRHISVGEVVLRNAPLAFGWHGISYRPQQQESSHRMERCAACFTKTSKLSRCGRCKVLWYCSRDCQKRDFPYHKVECQAASLFAAIPNGPDQDRVWEDASLLIRTFLALRRNNEQCQVVPSPTTLSKEVPGTTCGQQHFDDLVSYDSTHRLTKAEYQAIELATAALYSQFKVLKLSGTKTDLQGKLEHQLRVFRVNNFAITDELLNVMAGAVYPLGALLNHSCSPNCLVRYHYLDRGATGPVLELVACRDIPQGEELTHSYIELVQPTPTRQSHLHNNHGFTCQCSRCRGHARVPLPKEHRTLGAKELTAWILRRYQQPHMPESIMQGEVIEVELDQAMSPVQIHPDLVQASLVKRQQAKQYMATGDLVEELQCLEEAVQLLSSGDSGALSLELYQARGDRLGTLIVAGETAKAVEECEHIVAFLCVALDHVPNHPLLGLQLFTLGDLYQAAAEMEKAQTTHRWAKHSLSISQGPNSEMVQLLHEKLG